MNIPQLRIGNLIATTPIVQGGMGVRISLASLAAAVAQEGGIGTISSIGLGDFDASHGDYERVSREALRQEIRKARAMTSGVLAVNFMGVLRNVEELIQTAVSEGIQMIVFGAGLPMRLPKIVEDASVNLVPIVSSARGAELILRGWEKRFDRTASAIILEGPLAGGHLGFTPEQLEHLPDFSLESLIPEAVEAVKPFEDRFSHAIPVLAAGGIFNGRDIARMLSLGASGVQMATRFVCTQECDAAQAFKQTYLDAKEEDIVIVKSPVGLPGRAIRNRFLKDLEKVDRLSIHCLYHCLTVCKVAEAKFCIAQALLNACQGDIDHGLIFCGQNAHRIHEIVTVKELMSELRDELQAALNESV
ncbi:nitronate monooxygenase family protein [Candidatus Bipolaricaulota bacterium]|nr:nitronate monooxygenase family protein [Candidatus Bipolaricaulota bacterium]